MAGLAEKRVKFSKMIGLLYHYMDFLGLLYAKDMGRRCQDCPVGHPNSTHKAGLAEDIVIYGPGYSYPHPTANQIYSDLHDFWDLLGGAERIDDDLNHFSLEHNGVR